MYEAFVEAFDGNDNGIAQYDGLAAHGIEARYKSPWSLFNQVSLLNPEWNEHGVDIGARFLQAVAVVTDSFRALLRSYVHAWLPARSILRRAYEARGQDADGRILVLDTYCPWADHLYEMEKEGTQATVIYVVFEDSTGTSWRIQGVPAAEGSFDCRLGLPPAWRGLRDGALEEACGVAGATFVHRTGFIGANATRQGALAMATAALAQH